MFKAVSFSSLWGSGTSTSVLATEDLSIFVFVFFFIGKHEEIIFAVAVERYRKVRKHVRLIWRGSLFCTCSFMYSRVTLMSSSSNKYFYDISFCHDFVMSFVS